MPQEYPEQLAAFVDEYRRSDVLPNVDTNKLSLRPKDTFRMFPTKCRRALSYASPSAKLIFHALWDQHEEKKGRANGVLVGSIEWLADKTAIYNRNQISSALIELEVRGLIRTKRGRGGNGTSHPNLFLLTAFPDCLGNAPTADYEQRGLPPPPPVDLVSEKKPLADIASKFNACIAAQIEMVRYKRQRPREYQAIT